MELDYWRRRQQATSRDMQVPVGLVNPSLQKVNEYILWDPNYKFELKIDKSVSQGPLK